MDREVVDPYQAKEKTRCIRQKKTPLHGAKGREPIWAALSRMARLLEQMILNPQWFAIRVKSRSEKAAANSLAAYGIEVFAAAAPQRRVWVDRVRVVEMPLFPGYIFGRFDLSQRRTVEDTAGVASIVRIGNESCPVEDAEIAALRKLIASGTDIHRSPFLEVGAPVRVKHGPLTDTLGTLVQMKNQFRLVISVMILQRAVSVEIDEAMVEPVRKGQRLLSEVA